MKVWIEGEVVDGSEARISVLDHGLLYGDGVFEGIRVYGRRVFRLEDHLRRFATAAKALCLELPGGTAAVRGIVLETARAFGADEAYVRLIATRGDGPHFHSILNQLYNKLLNKSLKLYEISRASLS